MTNESKRKVTFFESANFESLQNAYMDWMAEKTDKISNVKEEFSVDGGTYYIAVFFDKEIE